MSDYLSKVPTLDISKFTSGNQKKAKNFLKNWNSFNQTGFAIIKNHGLTEETTKNLYSSIQTFLN